LNYVPPKKAEEIKVEELEELDEQLEHYALED
jgi:hypothetical protein